MANVCSKGGVEYATVNEAIKAEGQEAIKLLTAVSEDVVVPQRKYATIDLNGQTLTCVASHAIEVERRGTLTVMSSTGKGTVDCIVNAKSALYVGPGASATIEAGTFTRSKEDSKNGSNTWYVIQNHGSLVIDGTASINGTSTFTSAVENGFDSGRQADMDAFNSMGDSDYTASLTVIVMAYGGIMEKCGVLDEILDKMKVLTRTVGTMVCTTVVIEVLLNMITASQYLTIVLGGKLMMPAFKEKDMLPQCLSRTLEDAGTVTSLLFPWNLCGAFATAALGVNSFQYLPFALFNLICPLIAIVWGFTGMFQWKTGQIASKKTYRPVDSAPPAGAAK